MAYPERKRVTFEEPIFVDIVDEDEKTDLQCHKSRPRSHKFLLLALAAVALIFLFGRSHVRRCSQTVQTVQKQITHKYNHVAEQITTKLDVKRPVKASTGPTNVHAKPKGWYQPPRRVNDENTISKRDGPNPSADVCNTPTCKDWANSIKSNLASNHTQLDPCTSFDTYVCGGWRETHDYRPDQASVSIGSIMGDVNKNMLHSILEGEYSENATTTDKPTDKENFAKMKLAYNTCKDEAAIKSYGISPLRAILDEFENHYPLTGGGSRSGNDELTLALIWLAKNSVSGFVSAGVTVHARKKTDDKKPDVNMIAVGAGEHGLPSKEYYNQTIAVANYTRSLGQMFQVVWTGIPIGNDTIFQDAKPMYMETAKRIVDLERKLAFASPDRDRASEITASQLIQNCMYYYNPTTPAEMDKLVPEISFSNLIKAQAPSNYSATTIINSDPEFFTQISSIIKSTPRDVTHAYFQSRLIAAWAGRLSKDYTLPRRVFSNSLAGRDPFSESERWRTCLSEVDGALGWILSAAFVQRAFSADAKTLGDRIVKDIKTEFSGRLHGFEWMSNATKEVAARKVVNIIQKIGYPTASPNIVDPKDLKKYYSDLHITSNWFNNGREGARWGSKRSWDDLLKPVDRNRWGMTAPTVNAYYSPSGNEIVFPAGIMQLPVFGDELPEYVSYGAFGSVAGHELTHGFDNNGQHYDENGVYADWWDNNTQTNFNKKTQCFVDQYSKYTVPGLDGKPLHINGKLTLGENIADAGGVSASFAAWQKRDKAAPNKLMPGLEEFTKEQMFFISYSNWWCGKVRPAQAVNYIYTDPHSPADKRILGTLANSAGFREAFNCPSKQPTCELW